jgi:hypothetical protein
MPETPVNPAAARSINALLEVLRRDIEHFFLDFR